MASQEYTRFMELRDTVGKAALNTMFPKDFEYYMVSFELVDSNNKVVKFFTFPIMPESLTENIQTNQKIKKTAGGITILSSNTFQPVEISLNGSFGRSFKFLLGGDIVTGNGFLSGIKDTLKSVAFSTRVKTGYGCIKVLQDMIQKSNELDSLGNPYRLYFYNTITGNSYWVKNPSMRFNNTIQKNMMAEYSLSMTGVANLGDIVSKGYSSKKQLVTQMTTSLISQQLTSLTKPVKKMISGEIDNATGEASKGISKSLKHMEEQYKKGISQGIQKPNI